MGQGDREEDMGVEQRATGFGLDRARQSLVISFLLWDVFINGRFGLASEVVIPNLQKGDPKLVDSEGIDDGVHGRIAVCEKDGNVDQDAGFLAGGAEEGDTVQDVQR